MKIKLAGIVAVAAFLGLAMQTGCNKKKGEKSGKGASATSADMCTSACKKMKECSDAFAEVALKGMPDKIKAQAKAQMKKQFADMEKCKKQCENSKKKGEDKKIMDKCLGKKDCKAFAECVMAETKKKAPQPPKAPTAPTMAPATGAMAPAAGGMAPAAGGMAPAAMAPAAGAMTAPKK